MTHSRLLRQQLTKKFTSTFKVDVTFDSPELLGESILCLTDPKYVQLPSFLFFAKNDVQKYEKKLLGFGGEVVKLQKREYPESSYQVSELPCEEDFLALSEKLSNIVLKGVEPTGSLISLSQIDPDLLTESISPKEFSSFIKVDPMDLPYGFSMSLSFYIFLQRNNKFIKVFAPESKPQRYQLIDFKNKKNITDFFVPIEESENLRSALRLGQIQKLFRKKFAA